MHFCSSFLFFIALNGGRCELYEMRLKLESAIKVKQGKFLNQKVILIRSSWVAFFYRLLENKRIGFPKNTQVSDPCLCA